MSKSKLGEDFIPHDQFWDNQPPLTFPPNSKHGWPSLQSSEWERSQCWVKLTWYSWLSFFNHSTSSSTCSKVVLKYSMELLIPWYQTLLKSTLASRRALLFQSWSIFVLVVGFMIEHRILADLFSCSFVFFCCWMRGERLIVCRISMCVDKDDFIMNFNNRNFGII